MVLFHYSRSMQKRSLKKLRFHSAWSLLPSAIAVAEGQHLLVERKQALILRETQREPRLHHIYIMYKDNRFHYRQENPNLFILDGKHVSTLCSRGEHCYHPRLQASLRFTLKGHTTSSKAFPLTNILVKTVQNKTSQNYCSQDMQKCERPTENYIPTISIPHIHLFLYIIMLLQQSRQSNQQRREPNQLLQHIQFLLLLY